MQILTHSGLRGFRLRLKSSFCTPFPARHGQDTPRCPTAMAALWRFLSPVPQGHPALKSQPNFSNALRIAHLPAQLCRWQTSQAHGRQRSDHKPRQAPRPPLPLPRRQGTRGLALPRGRHCHTAPLHRRTCRGGQGCQNPLATRAPAEVGTPNAILLLPSTLVQI